MQQANEKEIIMGTALTDQADQEYLTFTAAGLDYGIGILSVREIRGWTPETPLPNSPPAVRGIINLRGQIVPIYDLRVRLGSAASSPSGTHVVIVVEAASGFYGILVDAVSDILSVSPSELQPVPQTSMEPGQELLTSLLARQDRMVSLLDLDLLVCGRSAETTAEMQLIAA
jgi:purine-binding chemotaxis protein CheW